MDFASWVAIAIAIAAAVYGGLKSKKSKDEGKQ